MSESVSEKRKYKRLPIKLTLEVSSLFKQNEKLQIGNAEFNVFNISKSGLGFTTRTQIPLGYYFNAAIEFEGTTDILRYVVKIIRTEDLDNGLYLYGCEFVGLANFYDYLFDEYESSIEQ